MPMGFVVKLSGRSETACWLSAPTEKRIRRLVRRERAEVFETPEDARSAVEKLPPAFVKSGFVFSVESDD
jgi:hypothetical protein